MKFSNLARRRIIILGILYFIQLALLAGVSALTAVTTSSYLLLAAISSLFFSVIILNSHSQPEFKTSWIIIILIFPIFGGVLYLFLRNQRPLENQPKNLDSIRGKINRAMEGEENILEDRDDLDPDAGHLSQFISENFYALPSNTTDSEYLHIGEEYFARLLEDLKKARKYIFIEYYIIEKGYMLEEILNVLFERAKAGVEIRLVYDDAGNILRIDEEFVKCLNENGIQTAVFNPLRWILSFQYNYRNHRKIVAIDGKVAYTGGMNIGDNYINKIEVAGHWKDGGVRLEGEAAWGFTLMAMSLWEHLKHDLGEFSDYKPHFQTEIEPVTKDGFLQPFTDEPTHNLQISESIYLKLIYNAKDSIYLKTPYLIFSQKLYSALETAAISGVDVRIITPGKPDKKIVYETSQSFYERLIKVGVKIYEYTPGFMHEKVLIIDDDFAINGTINFDYRSFYHSFECGVLFYRTNSIGHMKKDFLDLFPQCHQVTYEETQNQPLHTQFIRSVLQLVAPLM